MAMIDPLAELVVATSYDDLPPEVVAAAKNRLGDTIGGALSAHHFRLANSQPLIDVARESGGNAEATVIGEGKQFTGLWAALINGCQAFSFLVDNDRYSGSHPGAVVPPASMAVGEWEDAGGKQLITAVVLGYEVHCRIGRVIYPADSDRGFHATSVVGPFGAAAAAGKIMGLDEQQMRNALCLAGTLGAGLLEAFGSFNSAATQAGRASQSGVLAALLARKGAAGSKTILEGGGFGTAKGYLDAHAEKYNLELLTRGLGREYMILDIAPRIWAGSRHIHAPIDAVRELIKQYPVTADNIQEIKLGVYAEAARLDPPDPMSSTSSLAFAAAAPILIGDPLFDKITVELLRDSKTQELMAKVRVEVDPEVDNAFPEHWGARVEVVTTEGNRYQVRIPDPWGERENPMSKPEADERFRRLARPELGDETAEKVLRFIDNLEELPRVANLTALLYK